MIFTFQAVEGQEPYCIDAGALNNELAAALGGWCNGWSASHNATQAIVTLSDERSDQAAQDLVAATVAAHIADADKREHNKAIDAQIAALEATVTQRMLRERGARLDVVDAQISTLRKQRV